MGKIWITSDTHFGHDREFIWGPRGYASAAENDADIIKKWNEVVSSEDTVYHLGDVMLGDNTNGMDCLSKLNGDIHIIRGNHDNDSRMEIYRGLHNVVEVCEGKFLRNGKYHFYLSHYPCLTSNWDEDKPLKARVANLCGHSHTKDHFADWDKGLIFHCEMDTNNCEPILLDDIIKKIEITLAENK